MPRFGNLQDIWNKLDEILSQLSSGGNGGYATEAKQDDIITEIQNTRTELQNPSALATQAKQDDVIAELTGSQRTINAVEVTTAGSTTAGVQSVSLLFDGNGGTLNGVSVPNRYFAGYSPNGINDTVNSISYTPPTTGSGRIIITYVL